MEHRSNPFVSVIVPVFNDAERLRICLEKLEQQTYPQHLYEVIVVDNGSDVPPQVQEVVALFHRATFASEDTPGSYAARNRGIAIAKGEVIAFTDADCIPALDWIEKGVETLLKVPNCGLAVGQIHLLFENPTRTTLVELYESLTAFRQAEYVQKYKGGATANLFTFKQVIDRVGVFNAKLKSGGDLEWGRRVHALGYQQVYASEACVSHPARSSLTQLQRKVRRVAGGVYDSYVDREQSVLRKNKAFLRLLYDDFILAIKSIFAFATSPKLNNFSSKMGVFSVVLFVSYTSMTEKIMLRLGKASVRA